MPLELQKLCCAALFVIDNEFYLILDEDLCEDLWAFCMNFFLIEPLNDDYSGTPLCHFAETLGDKFFLEATPLFFNELARIQSIMVIPQPLLEKLQEVPSSTGPKFALGVASASLFRDFCLERISTIASEEDRAFLQTLIDRFYVPNRFS